MNSIDKIVLTVLVALACPLCLPLVIDKNDIIHDHPSLLQG